MNEIKVLQVIGGLNRGGAETMLMNIYRIIDKKYKFIFLTYTKDNKIGDYEQEILNNGDQIIKLNLKRVHNPITFFMDLKKIIKKEKFDCIHCHTLFNSGIVMLVAKMNHIPVRIVHSHSSGIMKENNVVNKLYFGISRFLINKCCTIRLACNRISGTYLYGKNQRFIILKNGIDLNKFSPFTKPAYLIDEHLENRQALKIAAISSFYEVKNHTFMIKIAKCLKEMNIEFTLFFVGRGPLEEKLHNQVEEYGVQDKVLFLGVLENVHEFLPALDLILMPSLYEGIPVSLIEAQASGVPAIISNRIAKDVDLGLGLIKFLEIECEPEKWAKEIVDFHVEKLRAEEIQRKVQMCGYDVRDNVSMLSSLYEGKNFEERDF